MELVNITRQKAQADALFLSIGEGAIATDEKGQISRINRAAKEILHFKDEDVIGKWFPGTIVAVDENGKAIKPIDRPITRAVVSGKVITERAFYRTNLNKIVPVFLTVSPILLDDKPIGAIEVFRDISAELEVDQMKSDFISIASHQLRTPATAVKNFIGLLLEGYAGELTEEQSFIIEQAYQSNEAQLEIVNNLLYAARADSSSVKLKLTKHDLAGIVRETVQEHRAILKERKQKVTSNIPKTAHMTMDKHFMRMMVENLVSNASKYTPDKGKISIKLETSPNRLRLQVSDTGVGIAKIDQQKLFQRFSRVENELSTIRGGSGIGLYLVKRIVSLHRGHIQVTSKEGGGSIFTVTLPKEQ